ncbi:MAG TPA: site-2 protease family protein, partial [Leptolyngbyaceae cyanobacterium M65_K2018_010]|nr:site-2 protease family protein [Leptolyngbyaceae cyanobacterium M65_K2018_010]
AGMTLRQFADTYLLEEKQVPAYFAASEGRYRGLVSIEALRSVERSEWEVRTLHDIVQPLLTIPSVRENTPLTEAIARLEELALPRITVLTPADAVGGTLDRGDIVRALADRLGLRVSTAVIQRIKDEGQYPPGLQLPSIARTVTDELPH